MRRDSIFYQLFQQSPSLLFELLPASPTDAERYRFDSIVVKETSFEIDGVFLPPETDPPGVVYFCEVQFQRDEKLYERLFGELFLYFYRNRQHFSDWQAVIIYPSCSIEQSQIAPYRGLLESHQVHRIYLNELGPIEHLPLGVALIVLTILEDDQAVTAARQLVERSRQTDLPEPIHRGIMDMLTTILVYKFTKLSRREIEAMLDLNVKLEETRFYQEAKAEGLEEGQEKGERIGQQREALSLVTRLLGRRLNQSLTEELRDRLAQLSLTQLEDLGEALLDFGAIADLETWFQTHASQ